MGPGAAKSLRAPRRRQSSHCSEASKAQEGDRHMAIYIGFDPGGAGAFGWAAASGAQFPLRLVARRIANHAHEAVHSVLVAAGQSPVTAAGIDAPLFWHDQGDRTVDQRLRNAIIQLGAHGGTVNSVNSMRGACLIQGMMAAMLLRTNQKQLPITEAHPKALLWLLGIARRGKPSVEIALGDLHDWITGNNIAGASDHERDACLGGISAFAMTQQSKGWQDLYLQEPNPLSPLWPAPQCWLPL